VAENAPTACRLAGLRVLAFEQYGAGPFGTQFLADLGAEVIKVESPHDGGDMARSVGPHFLDESGASDASLFFQAFNRNKRSITLDITKPEGRAVLERLVSKVDALACNLRGDVPARLGLTYETLSKATRSSSAPSCRPMAARARAPTGRATISSCRRRPAISR
jgi:succinate---hydroxymethylglutarate CoA-transferase